MHLERLDGHNQLYQQIHEFLGFYIDRAKRNPLPVEVVDKKMAIRAICNANVSYNKSLLA